MMDEVHKGYLIGVIVTGIALTVMFVLLTIKWVV